MAGPSLASGVEGDGKNVVIVTGLSGAGKSLALKHLEDLGYFCVDNLPPALIPTFINLCSELKTPIRRMAIVVDVRGGEFFAEFSDALKKVNQNGTKLMIVFLEADDDVLVRRYKVTRRRHPLSSHGSILEGIREERAALFDIKSEADVIIDTSDLTPPELRKQLVEVFSKGANLHELLITIVTFGFKHGLPLDADLVFDVRFLPNPYYEPELRNLSGLDRRVTQYVLRSQLTANFMARLKRFIDFLLPKYVDEGKSHLTITIGCTGGRHRSVVIGEALKIHLESKDHTVIIGHRDIERGEFGGPEQ